MESKSKWAIFGNSLLILLTLFLGIILLMYFLSKNTPIIIFVICILMYFNTRVNVLSIMKITKENS